MKTALLVFLSFLLIPPVMANQRERELVIKVLKDENATHKQLCEAQQILLRLPAREGFELFGREVSQLREEVARRIAAKKVCERRPAPPPPTHSAPPAQPFTPRPEREGGVFVPEEIRSDPRVVAAQERVTEKVTALLAGKMDSKAAEADERLAALEDKTKTLRDRALGVRVRANDEEICRLLKSFEKTRNWAASPEEE